MIELIKKTVFAGVGAAVLTKDKIDASLREFVKQGKVSSKDAKAMARKLERQGRQQFVTASNSAGAALKKVLSRAERESQTRIDSLLAQIRKLEKKPAAASKRRAPQRRARRR